MSARRVPVNAAALLASRVFGAGVTVAVVSLAAHRLSVNEFGLVASTMAAGFLANSLITFGTDTVVTRAIAAERADASAVALASLKLQLGAALLVVVAVAVALGRGLNAAVFVQAMALVPLAGATVGAAVLRGQQRMDRLLVAAAAGGLVTLVVLVVLFSRYEAPWVPIASLAVGSIVTAAISLGFSASTLQTHPGSVAMSSLPREAAPFAVMVFLAAVTAQAGPLLVEFASDDTAGGYGVAVRVTEAARLIPAAAMGAFFPAMLSGLHRTPRYRRWITGLFIYAAGATIGLLVLAGPINELLFDAQPGGATLIRILGLGTMLTVARLARSFELIASGGETAVLFSAIAGAAVSLVGGVALAKSFGAVGVAWAQLGGLVGAVAVLVVARSPETDSAATPLV